MSVEKLIDELFEKLEKEGITIPSLYNASKRSFDKSKDWVYYSGPVWDYNEPREAMKAFMNGAWLVAGEKCSRFEKEYSKKFGLKSSLMVNSGSSANLVMIAAAKKYFNWQDFDEIIVSPVGFPTTIAPLVQNNLKPVFVDIEFEHLNFDLNQVEAAITNKTKAIFISPVLGNPPDMDKLTKIAKSNNIELILDGCDSLGSKWRGKELSDYAVVTSCSFYPAHHITTGEGGMVSSNIEQLISLARSFAWWGRDCYCVGAVNLSRVGACGKRFDKWIEGFEGKIDHKYYFSNMGYNLKPLDLQGAMGLEQLKKFDDIHRGRVESKNKISALFEKHLGNLISIPKELPEADTSWFGVPIICHKDGLKEKLVEYLETNRVQTRNYFAGNILQHPAYKHLDDQKKYPKANQVLSKVFFVGCSPSYFAEVFDYYDQILSEFKKIIEKK